MFENILSKNPERIKIIYKLKFWTFSTKIFKSQWILRNSFLTISSPQQYRPFTVHGILVCYSLFSLWQSPIFRIHSLLLSNSNDIRWSAFNAAIRTVPSIMFYIVRWETQTLIRFILIGVFFRSLFQIEYKLLFAVSIEIIFLDESSAKLFHCAGISNCRIIYGILRTCAILKSNLFTFKHKHNKWVCCCLCNPNCVYASCVLCFYI